MNSSDSFSSKGDKGNESSQSKGDKEVKKAKTVKETAGMVKDAGTDVVDRVKKENSKATASAGANEFAKQTFLTQIKIRLQQLQQLVQQMSTNFISMIIGILWVAVVAVVSGVVDGGASSNGQKDEPFVECTAYIDKAMIGKTSKNITVDENKLKRQTAKRIYSVLHYYGLRPEQCFAVLGNWEHESGLDPTSVETVFDEPYTIGQKKQSAVKHDFVLKAWNPDYAEQFPTIVRNGIGLGQWTNDRNKKLVKYAKFYGMKDFKGDKSTESLWYDLDVQLAFALDTSYVGDSNASWFASWKNVGNDEWSGDKAVDIPFSGVRCWSSQTSKNGTFPDENISCTPIGENNDEAVIPGAGSSEDDYYSQSDRDKAVQEATDYMSLVWSGMIDTYKPEDYAHPIIVGDPDPEYDEDGNAIYNDEYDDGVDEANSLLKALYIKEWKKHYRYYLYENTVKTYTKQFMEEWEVCNDGSLTVRVDNALRYFYEWYDEANLISSEGEPNYYVDADNATSSGDYFFHVEEGYASGILTVMDKTKDFDFSLSKVYKYDENMQKCNRVSVESRKNLAQCAAMIAWPNNALSRGNDGTDIYKYIHDQVIKGDTIYQSCDRTICTAVRWSGYDDNYPPGSTLNQIQYLVSSPRWVELDWGGDKSQLQAGDILIRKDSMEGGATGESGGDVHHTIMYIGEYLAKTYADKDLGMPASGACIVHGSFNSRSPAIDVWNDSYSTYHAFRCIYPMGAGESKYAGIGYPY